MARSKDALLRLHARLVKRRDALRKALNGDMESFREYSATFEVGDTADAAVDTANDEINSQIAELESRELEQIENALLSIEKGYYGRCEICGGKIAEARLNALPYTTTCIDCQRESERMGSGYHAGNVARRWEKLGEGHDDDGESEVNLNDLEVDMSESGR